VSAFPASSHIPVRVTIELRGPASPPVECTHKRSAHVHTTGGTPSADKKAGPRYSHDPGLPFNAAAGTLDGKPPHARPAATSTPWTAAGV
jgi:hypothetical protein